jgi:hypothetical protein
LTSASSISHLASNVVGTIFELGHGLLSRTQHLIESIVCHRAVTTLVPRLKPERGAGGRIERIVRGVKNYVHANKLGSRGGTYRTETWKALKTVLHAAQFGEGSATLADLNAELGVSTRLSAAARGEEGLRARRTRRDKLPLRPALVFWHSSEIAQIDS